LKHPKEWWLLYSGIYSCTSLVYSLSTSIPLWYRRAQWWFKSMEAPCSLAMSYLKSSQLTYLAASRSAKATSLACRYLSGNLPTPLNTTARGAKRLYVQRLTIQCSARNLGVSFTTTNASNSVLHFAMPLSLKTVNVRRSATMTLVDTTVALAVEAIIRNAALWNPALPSVTAQITFATSTTNAFRRLKVQPHHHLKGLPLHPRSPLQAQFHRHLPPLQLRQTSQRPHPRALRQVLRPRLLLRPLRLCLLQAKIHLQALQLSHLARQVLIQQTHPQ